MEGEAPAAAQAAAPAPTGKTAVADDLLREKARAMRVTDEQRLLAATAEAELRERLEKELAASKSSELVVMESWRKILRLAKVEELRYELEVLSQNYERELERKDAAIVAGLRDIEGANAQHDTAVRDHLRALDNLIEIQDARLLSLEQEYRREVRTLEAEFSAERADVVARHRAFRQQLLHTLKAVREQEEAKMQAENADFEQAREALRRRSLERIHALQTDMDSAIEALERAFEDAHVSYLAATDKRSQDFKALTQRGQQDTLMNERQQRALKRLNKLLQLWRSRMSNNTRDCETRNTALEEERASMAAQLEALKADMTRKRTAHMARMKALSSAAATVKQKLADSAATAQRILSLAEAIRPLESGSEKVDPFAPSNGTLPAVAVGLGAGGTAVAMARAESAGDEAATLQQAAAVAAGSIAASGSLASIGAGAAAAAHSTDAGALTLQPSDVLASTLGLPTDALAPGAGDALEEAEALGHFYGRHNKVLMESLALERRRERLKAENAELQQALQQVLDGMAVTPSTVDGPNGLLIVNRRVTDGAGTTAAAAVAAANTGLRLGATGTMPVRLRPGEGKVATVLVESNVVAGGYRRMGRGM